jgi:serine/threonine protein kinase
VKSLSKPDCENLRNEIRLHQSLSHPSIIRFIDCLQIDNLVYILLENASNGSLFPYINQISGLPEDLALRFLYQTSLGIKYLHDNKIVHRDLKPENLLLDEGFNIKVCDFGWSCVLEGDQVRESLCGTYEYMSPEILNEEAHTSKVDIWCLGILLYEMLHGYSPFRGNSINEVKHQINNRNVILKVGLSKTIETLIGNLLNKNSEERFDIDQLLEFLCINLDVAEFNKPVSISHYEQLLNNYYEFKYKTSAPQNKIPEIENQSIDVKIPDEDGQVSIVKVPIPPNILIIEEKIAMITRFNEEEFIHRSSLKKMRRNSESALETINKLSDRNGDYELSISSRDTFMSRVIVRSAIEARMSFHPSGKIIVLERKMNWKKDFYNIEKEMGIAGSILFVLYYEPLFKGFMIEAIHFPGEKNVVRKLLKKAFRGRTSNELMTLTNLNDFNLCHATGVFGVTRSLLSAILVSDLSL